MKKLILLAIFFFMLAVSMNAQKTMKMTQRQQALVAAGALGAKGDVENLKMVLNQGFEQGMTVSELKEALSHIYAYAGFPRSLNALGALQSVMNDRKQSGLRMEPGKEADPLPDDYDALRQGTEVQTKLTGVPFNYTFAPQTDFYLKAHLFGDIFARNNLSFADRELITVGAISALEGCHPQLVAHVNGARNMGNSDVVIREIPEVLAKMVGVDESERVKKAIAQAFGE